MKDLCIVIVGGPGGGPKSKRPASPKQRCALPAYRQHVCVVHWWALNDRKKEQPDVQPTAAQ